MLIYWSHTTIALDGLSNVGFFLLNLQKQYFYEGEKNYFILFPSEIADALVLKSLFSMELFLVCQSATFY